MDDEYYDMPSTQRMTGSRFPVTQRRGTALCLSGGGYRAMLFHLGVLWRLNEWGYLPRIDLVSSVSGGSITAGVLGLAWSRLRFDRYDVASNFERRVVRPVRRLAGKTIDIWAVLLGLVGPGTASSYVARAYERYLFGGRTLQDLPRPGEGPLFIINASNLQSGVLWRFSRPYAWDYRVGKIEYPTVKLSVAVAASSAFPPFLSPMILEFEDTDYVAKSGMDLQRPPYTTRVYLTDGGVYDNLGLEAAWKSYSTVLVSDGGAKMSDEERPQNNWPRHTLRVLSLIDNQVRSLRKRQLIAQYIQGRDRGGSGGTYWAIRSHIRRYGLPDALRCPLEQTTRLARIPTRLAAMDSTTQEQLINWGYAICDAAMRKRVNPSLPPASAFPYPARGVGV